MKAAAARPPALPVVAIAIALAAGGCTVGPTYERPALAVPADWRTPTTVSATAADGAWWTSFGDPAIDALVAEALASSPDIAIAAARVDEYLGRYGQTRAAQFPAVGLEPGSTQVSRQRASRLAAGIPDGVDAESSLYAAALSASWELDLWGRLRRSTDAARADLLGQEEARRGVVVSLVAQVVSGYVALRDLDRQLEITQATLASRAESLRIFDLRFRGGVISALQLAQARAEFQAAAAAVPPLRTRIAQQENLLARLAGRNPGPIARGKPLTALAPPPIPAGLPSALLARRPDLRRAEQDLIAANARIGAARALYYPRISLTAALGVASPQLSDLVSGPARLWNVAGALAQPIFDAGRIAGQVAQAEAQQAQLVAAYRKAVQAAFADVDDALSATARIRDELGALTEQIDALKTAARLARLRFDNGYTDFIEVLDAERSLFQAELAQSNRQGAALASVVDVYKSRGGGWIDVADAKTPAAGARPPAERADALPVR